MHRSTGKTKSLTTATSLNEALDILKTRKAPAIFGSHVKLAFNLKNDRDHQIRSKMLNETEDALKEQEKKSLGESVVTEVENEGDHRKDGETGQADGRELDDVNPPGEGSHDGSAPAQSQKGESQLEAALSESLREMHTVDPMNQAIIDYMDDGMTQVEAQNAATKDTKLSEAVFKKNFLKFVVPIVKGVMSENRALKETIRLTDSKIEKSRSESGSLNETVNAELQWPERRVSFSPQPKYDSNPDKTSQIRDTIKDKYC